LGSLALAIYGKGRGRMGGEGRGGEGRGGEGRGGEGRGGERGRGRRKGGEGGRGVSPPKHKNQTPPMILGNLLWQNFRGFIRILDSAGFFFL
jgi:hypothetical protein